MIDYTRKTRYPWDHWLRPPGFEARRGIDFDVRTDVFVSMVRQRAVGRYHLRIDVSCDVVRVTILPRETVAPPSFDIFAEQMQ